MCDKPGGQIILSGTVDVQQAMERHEGKCVYIEDVAAVCARKFPAQCGSGKPCTAHPVTRLRQ